MTDRLKYETGRQVASILAHTLKPSCPECAKLRVTTWPKVAKEHGYHLDTFVGCWFDSVRDSVQEEQRLLRKGNR